jgi:hypothetical protein
MLLGGSKIKMAYDGGSSRVFKNALNAAFDKHVHLIDDIDLIFSELGRIAHLVNQITYVIDRVVGCCIKLINI